MNDGSSAKIQIWDTAGQERFHSVTKSYTRDADGVAFIYDVTNENCEHMIAKWVQDLYATLPSDRNIEAILIGNKIDLIAEEDRKFASEKLRAMAKRHGFRSYILASAKTSENVEQAFQRLIQMVWEAQRTKENMKNKAYQDSHTSCNHSDAFKIYDKDDRERYPERQGCC